MQQLHLHQISGDQVFSIKLLPTTFSQHEGWVRLQPAAQRWRQFRVASLKAEKKVRVKHGKTW